MFEGLRDLQGAAPSVSKLRLVVDSLRAETLAELPDASIEADLCELQRTCEALEIERARRVREAERRRLFERDGHLSVGAWLVARFRMSWAGARSLAGLGRSLEQMPVTRRGLEDGEISLAAARVLAGALAGEPEAFAEAERTLVEAAKLHSIVGLQRVAAHWRDVVCEGLGFDGRLARRFLHASTTLGGMVRVDADLDPETGESVLTAIRAVLDAEARSRTPQDDRTPSQRRADALGEVCRAWLERTDRPTVGVERPHITVTVPLDVLRSQGIAEFDIAGTASAEAARRLACDASVTRVVLGPRSEPLDVGRRTPVVPASMRRALHVRDGACRFPGCERPKSWCDAHHVRHWAHGGPTSVGNLVLLCRRHHRLIHEGGFSVVISGGRPMFGRPDGSSLDGLSPPLGEVQPGPMSASR